MTRSRRLLVVLDNAADEAQVRPLLPAAGEAAVVITARVPLTVVEPSQIVVVGHLDAGAAGALFQAWVGADRAPADDASVQDVVTACDGLAAGSAGGRGPVGLAAAVDGTRSRRPLWCRTSDAWINCGSVTSTYEPRWPAPTTPCRSQQQAALRRVRGRRHVATADVADLAAPRRRRRATAARRCDELVDAGLLHALGQPADAGDESFAVHDLVRILAAEQRVVHRAPRRDAGGGTARRRHHSELAVAVDAERGAAVGQSRRPGLAGRGGGLPAPTLAGDGAAQRLDTDHGAVLAVLDRAVEHLPPDDVWRAVVALAWFWENTGRFSEWAEVTQRLLDRPDAGAAAWATLAYTSLAGAHLARGDMAAAAAAYRSAVAGSGSKRRGVTPGSGW